MTYNVFTIAPLRPSVLLAALATCIGVHPGDVDVADAEGSQDDRNWGAAVLCDFTETLGDVSLSLDIYVQESAPNRLSEKELAAELAVAAQTVVLYPAEESIPSAYWLVTPDRTVTRARLLSSDDARPVYSIDAVESKVACLPEVPATPLDEIVREYPTPVPLTERFVTAVDAPEHSSADSVSTPLTREVGTPFYRARTALAEWERMVRRMGSGWQPTGHCSADMYRAGLRARNDIAQLINDLPAPTGELLRELAEQIDGDFTKLTEQDDGQALVEATGPLTGAHENAWWWQRKPSALPW
ncbi:hypothetical protein IPZ58_29775 [Streptomyces roseoverticillatus]|uniref:hypothetical protein n=1 Tax=Streptomyces roseoverticillatus TaxID=66429 RepID=UPI001F39BC3B|nr:hypothetical protein [Streptomyces roseoverticillatus]MCF3105746.1 hypothetical protein [Streptomyces roseoverticillatus]